MSARNPEKVIHVLGNSLKIHKLELFSKMGIFRKMILCKHLVFFLLFFFFFSFNNINFDFVQTLCVFFLNLILI